MKLKAFKQSLNLILHKKRLMKKITFQHFMTEMLRITFYNNSSYYTNTFLIFLNFLQLLSFIFKLNFDNFNDEKFRFFYEITLYSNFSNILIYFSSNQVTYLAFGLTVCLVHFILLYPIFLTFFKRWLNIKFSDNAIIKFLNVIYQKILQIFNWILVIPILEICMNLTDCESFSYIQENINNPNCSIPIYIWCLVFWVCGLSFMINFFYLWIFVDNTFLNISNLKADLNFFSFLALILKFIVVISFSFIYDKMRIFVYFFLLLISVILLLDYFKNFPIRNQKINRRYIASLCSFVTYVFLMLIWNYTNLLKQYDLFYIQSIMVILAYKAGENIQENNYHRILRTNFKEIHHKNFLIEEMIFLFENKEAKSNYFLLKGIFQQHIKQCKVPFCKLRKKHMENFEELNEILKLKIINDFIVYLYSDAIEEANRPGSSSAIYVEKFIMKYASFLTNFNLNSIKAFFEIQKILSKFSKSKLSYYFQCVKSVVLNDIKTNIYEKEKEKALNIGNNSSLIDEKQLDIATFLDILREKHVFEEYSLKLLKEKIEFWDNYKNGLQSYEEAFKTLTTIIKKLKKFQRDLSEKMSSHSRSRNFFLYKYSSFFQCILFNNINEAIKLEEEIDLIKKREFTQNTTILSYITFFDDTTIPIKASFVRNHGEILEESKTSKLSEIFGYTKEELKSLNLIDLMPSIIAEYHDSFFEWYLNKPINKNLPVKKFSDVYAKKKDDLIFPINFFIGYAFHIKDDFVFNAIIKPSRFNDGIKTQNKGLLFDEKGIIQGVNDEFFKMFLQSFPLIKPSDFKLLSIFSLVHNLKDILEKNNVLEQRTNMTIRNQTSNFLLPKNLMEIIDILQIKHKEESNFTNEISFYSKKSKSNKMLKSLTVNNNSSNANKNQQSPFLMKFYRMKNVSLEKKTLFNQKYKENSISNKDIIDELINEENIERLLVSYDLKIHFYSYGLKQTNNLMIVYFTINRVKTINIDNKNKTYNDFTIQTSYNKQVDPFAIPESSLISDVPTNFLQMPPENIPDFGQMSNNSDRNLSDLLPPALLEEIRLNQGNINTSERLKNMKNDANMMMIQKSEVDIQSSRKSYEVRDSVSRKVELQNLPIKENFFSARALAIEINEFRNSSQNNDPDFNSFNSSKSNVKEKQIEDSKGGHSDKAIVDMDIASQSASSIGELNKTFSIFKSISKLQTTRPRVMFTLAISFWLEICFIVIYCIVIYQFSVQYISTYYNPLQFALENFSRFTTSLSTATMASTELEFYKRNLSWIEENSLEKSIIFEVIEEAFVEVRYSINKERNNPTLFEYQTLFKDSFVNVTDPSEYITKKTSFPDFLDDIIQQIGDIVHETLQSLNLDKLGYLAINFESFSVICYEIIQKIKRELIKTNDETSQSIFIVMIIFVIISILIKIFQLKKILEFYDLLIRLMNIFLRVNEKAAINEVLFLKAIQEKYMNDQDKSNIVFINFPEKCLNKKDYDITSLKDFSINSKKSVVSNKLTIKKNESKKKRTSLHNLKPIHMRKEKFLICIFFLLIFSYFFFIYLYWIVIDAKVVKLIEINNYFNEIYTLPSLIQCLNILLIREKISYNEQLEKSEDPFQKHENRLNYFNDRLNLHLEKLNRMAASFPAFIFNAEEHINNRDLDVLINGNICNDLYQNNIFLLEEKEKCELLLNGAFTRGIINTLNQIINQVNSLLSLGSLDSKYNTTLQLEGIMGYIDEGNVETLIVEHFFQETNQQFFNFMTVYYDSMIISEINNMELVILLTTVVIEFVTIAFALFSYKKMKTLYEEVSLSLSLIPYERLMNDEQTVFLIKKFI